MLKKRSFLSELLKIRVLHRVLALFFILFTFLDIVLFGYCGEELPFPTTCLSEIAEITIIETTSIPGNEIVPSITLEQEHKNNDQAPCNTDDDCCFCCCSHWVLTNKLSLDKTEVTLPLEPPNKISLLESPPSKTYHPPRAI